MRVFPASGRPATPWPCCLEPPQLCQERWRGKRLTRRKSMTVSNCMLVAQTASTSPSFALLICCGCPLTCSRFFEHYSASLPIIDPTLSPDQCYSQSPFLFWAIVCIGSRRYPDDPTLLGWLAPRINSCFIHISCDSLAFGCSLLLPPPKFGAFGFWDLTPPTLIGTM
jgi:hypothetical protein